MPLPILRLQRLVVLGVKFTLDNAGDREAAIMIGERASELILSALKDRLAA